MTHDFIILGSGPAGLAAAIYARRYELRTLVIGELHGGTVTQTSTIENYPGIESISGIELGKNFAKHAKHLGAELLAGAVTSVSKSGDHFLVHVGKSVYSAKSILFATGTEHRKLGVSGEKEFTHRGVSYCATCDAAFFKNKTVAVVGGSDSAVKESLILAEHAKKVFIIYRGRMARAEPITLRRMEANPKIELLTDVNVLEIYGDKVVRGVRLDTGTDLPLDGVFVEVGRIPRSAMAQGLGVACNEKGEIKINRQSCTNVPGIFAAGDVTDSDWKQVIIAVAEGARAAASAFDHAR